MNCPVSLWLKKWDADEAGELLREIRKMRFEEAYEGWQEGRLRQCEAARLLGVSERTLLRYAVRYSDEGLQRLIDQRLAQVSHRKAPVDEVLRVTERYRARHAGWSAKHDVLRRARGHGQQPAGAA